MKKAGIVSSKKTKGYKVFTEYVEADFLNNTMSPSEYVNCCWGKYTSADVEKTNALNGTIFELIVETLLVKEGIVPLHIQAQIAFVPNIEFDVVLYNDENGPVALSLKTSLRERYKQADLEAIALKYVHRKARNYLVTMDEAEAASVKEKIKNGAVLGIDKVIVATTNEMDCFILELKEMTFILPGKVDIVTASNVVSEDRIAKLKS